MRDCVKAAKKRYKQKTKRFQLVLYPTDTDIIQRLETISEPKTTYIKRLIREDMEKVE